nr:hypothetical protein Iba_chr09eCG12380 [Ipomoea batatas]
MISYYARPFPLLSFQASKDAEECGIGLPKQFLFKSRCQPFSITSGRVGDYRSSCIAPFEKRDERGRDIRDSLTNNLAMFSNFILMVAILEVAINGRGSYYLTIEFVLVSSAHCASRKRSTQSQHGSSTTRGKSTVGVSASLNAQLPVQAHFID